MRKHNFRNLKIYKRAIDYSIKIYSTTRSFPQNESYGLTSQIRRAVVSISLNIAEGSAGNSPREFSHFLRTSLGSIYEVIACLEIALKLNYCTEEDIERLIDEANEIASMIVGFSKTLT